jgi:hypothetical protein
MYRTVKVVMVVACLVLSSALRAGETSVATLAGHWTYDNAKSRVLDPDLRIARTGTGTLRAEGISGAPYEFDLVGGSYPLSNGRTVTWARTEHETWKVTRKKNDDVLETGTVALSGNTLRRATQGKLPNGSPYERTVLYRRDGRGEGLVGRWRAVKVDTGTTWDGFVISVAEGDIVTWRIPTDLQFMTGPLDGSDLPVIGPNGATGSTMAFHEVAPRRFDYVTKDGGKITERGIVTISSDRRWLTELTWDEDQPARKSRLVYKREP